MAENTEISWADDTWSPWYGCTQISMGEKGACQGCYARHMSETRFGRVVFGGPGRGEGTRDVRADSAWKEPLKWNREQAALWAEYDRMVGSCSSEDPRPDRPEPRPRFIFPSMCDPFDNHPALSEPRRRFFDLIRATPNLTWLLLTKRPGNIVKLFIDCQPGDRVARLSAPWPRNAAIGCTIVTQEEADRDIPKLLAAKAALNPTFAFLSMEPLLGPVDIGWALSRNPIEIAAGFLRRGSFSPGLETLGRLDWIITGGETDQGAHKARPADPAWFRSLRDQCAAAEAAFHFKQWGEWVGAAVYSEERDGKTHGGLTRVEGGGAAPGAPTEWWDGDCWAGRVSVRVGKANDPGTLDGVTHHARPQL